MRRMVAFLALSADGFLARPDGDIGWLNRPEPPGGYGMRAFTRSVDTIIMGRKTYDIGRKFGAPYDPKVKYYVFSRRGRPKTADSVEFVNEDIGRFAARLRRQEGKNVWLMGGGELFAAFLDRGALDELIIYIIPILIGAGIPLLAAARRTTELHLQSTRRYSDGVVRLHYLVESKPKRPSRSSGRKGATQAAKRRR